VKLKPRIQNAANKNAGMAMASGEQKGIWGMRLAHETSAFAESAGHGRVGHS
jgi:hypothetical protein